MTEGINTLKDGYVIDVLACYLTKKTKPRSQFNNNTEEDFYQFTDYRMIIDCCQQFGSRYYPVNINYFDNTKYHAELICDMIQDMTLDEIRDYITMVKL